MSNQLYNVGDKIKFHKEKQRYTVRAASKRYLICTKPMNALKTILYTIVDLKEKIRGSDNMVFCCGYETEEDLTEAMEMLESGDMEVSYRNRIPLDIDHKAKKT